MSKPDKIDHVEIRARAKRIVKTSDGLGSYGPDVAISRAYLDYDAAISRLKECCWACYAEGRIAGPDGPTVPDYVVRLIAAAAEAASSRKEPVI